MAKFMICSWGRFARLSLSFRCVHRSVRAWHGAKIAWYKDGRVRRLHGTKMAECEDCMVRRWQSAKMAECEDCMVRRWQSAKNACAKIAWYKDGRVQRLHGTKMAGCEDGWVRSLHSAVMGWCRMSRNQAPQASLLRSNLSEGDNGAKRRKRTITSPLALPQAERSKAKTQPGIIRLGSSGIGSLLDLDRTKHRHLKLHPPRTAARTGVWLPPSVRRQPANAYAY